MKRWPISSEKLVANEEENVSEEIFNGQLIVKASINVAAKKANGGMRKNGESWRESPKKHEI